MSTAVSSLQQTPVAKDSISSQQSPVVGGDQLASTTVSSLQHTLVAKDSVSSQQSLVVAGDEDVDQVSVNVNEPERFSQLQPKSHAKNQQDAASKSLYPNLTEFTSEMILQKNAGTDDTLLSTKEDFSTVKTKPKKTLDSQLQQFPVEMVPLSHPATIPLPQVTEHTSLEAAACLTSSLPSSTTVGSQAKTSATDCNTVGVSPPSKGRHADIPNPVPTSQSFEAEENEDAWHSSAESWLSEGECATTPDAPDSPEQIAKFLHTYLSSHPFPYGCSVAELDRVYQKEYKQKSHLNKVSRIDKEFLSSHSKCFRLQSLAFLKLREGVEHTDVIFRGNPYTPEHVNDYFRRYIGQKITCSFPEVLHVFETKYKKEFKMPHSPLIWFISENFFKRSLHYFVVFTESVVFKKD